MCQHPRGALTQPLEPQVGTGHGTRSHLPPCLPQIIRQLGNDIEKMLLKIHSGQSVTNLYLRLQEVLRRVSCSSPCHCLPCSPCKGSRSQGQRAGALRALSQHRDPGG